MQGYDVVTCDDHKVGKVVGTEGSNLIVESGTIRKRKHPIPRAVASVEESEEIVRLSISKSLVDDSPTVNRGSIDEAAVAEYYGISDGHDAPTTQGYGEVMDAEQRPPSDPPPAENRPAS